MSISRYDRAKAYFRRDSTDRKKNMSTARYDRAKAYFWQGYADRKYMLTGWCDRERHTVNMTRQKDFKTLFLSLEARKIFLRSRKCQIQTYTMAQTQTQDPPPPPPTHTHKSKHVSTPVCRCEDRSTPYYINYYDPREVQWENRKTLCEKCS